MTRGRSRKLWVQAHLWLGLIFGVWFAIEGLTGSLLAFDYEIDLWLHPSLRGDCAAGEAMAPLDRVLSAARAATASEPKRIGIPYGEGVARIYADGPGEPEVAVDRCSGRVLLVRDFGFSLVGFVYQIHTTLLLGEAGGVGVGLCGLALVASVASGLVLWWPRKRGLLHALKVKTGASRFRLYWDLHKLAGAVGGLVLGLVALTGTGAAFPETLRMAMGSFFTLDAPLPAPPLGAPPELQLAADAAQAALPDAILMGVKLSKAGAGGVTVRLRRPWEPMKYSGQSQVLVDRSGRVLAVRDTMALSPASQVLDWIFPLHTGEAFSFAGRLVVCVAGVFPAFLITTGVVIWSFKRSRRRQGGEG